MGTHQIHVFTINDNLVQINGRLDRIGVPYELNERFLEEILDTLKGTGPHPCPAYFLTLARVMEATLLCAGHYADNCEFSAAGDLLVNPRKIRVHVKGGATVFEKARHGRLTDHLAEAFPGCRGGSAVAKRDTACEIVAPALLPYLYCQMTLSGYFSRTYLNHLETQMTAVANTIGFLAAGQILSIEALHLRLQTVDPEEKAFIEKHLCRFDDTWFRFLGMSIRSISSAKRSAASTAREAEASYANPFLNVLADIGKDGSRSYESNSC